MTEILPNEDLLKFENGGRFFDIHTGVPEQLAGQLIEKSKQPHIFHWTEWDSADRFKDEEAIYRHINKGRYMYLLTHDDDLAGTIWYGQKEFPNREFGEQTANHTFAIRIYEGYLHQGLARPFMDRTLKHYLQTFIETPRLDQFNGLWLSMDYKNTAGALYLTYGYEIVGQANGRLFMVLSEGKIRDIAGA